MFIPDNFTTGVGYPERDRDPQPLSPRDLSGRDSQLVKKGFIVLADDPYGQGERIDYFDAEKGGRRSVVRRHSLLHRNQMFLTGVSPAVFHPGDGIRAIDYLLTREEVDPERIGVTGLSGGGTQTAYISIFDDRVKAAAQSCYITGFRRLLESIGPQDAEQNFYHAIARGLTHADFLEVRAPRPTLIVATTRDFFSIQGVRETYAEASKAYAAFGHEDHLLLSENDYEHGFTAKNDKPLRVLQRFLELPGDPSDEPVETPCRTAECDGHGPTRHLLKGGLFRRTQRRVIGGG